MNGRIVILEDDEDIRELFNIFLQEHGFEIHLFSQIFENLADVERLAPDLLIVDLFIGGTQEGWDFVHRLKAHPATAHIPLILCTAGKLTSEQQSTTESYGIPILYKPFELDELHLLVHRFIGSSSRVAEGPVAME
jgi:two-component system, OmpR family, phosphate regulon response regulator PhoB